MAPAEPQLPNTEQVGTACDRFKSEWLAGANPRIDDYVAAAPETERESLRQALQTLLIELQRLTEVETAYRQDSSLEVTPKAGATVEFPEQDETPEHIGRFKILGTLGSGAFGKVFRATDPQLDREVAIKTPLKSSDQSDSDRDRFLREARSAATINHPNICQVHEVGEADGVPYIVMALVHGQSLADMLAARKRPFSVKQAAIIVRKIALALASAHEKGGVHRDLKPANVMFDRERKDIVVMDFGLARRPNFGDARGTQSGVILGTPAYMSPEQARGDAKGVGPESDIFSLGVILYELLTGVRPYSGTVTEVIGQILHVEPQPPSCHRPDIDSRLEALCLKAMSKEPADRFASMREFAKALDEIIKGTTGAADTARASTTRQGKDKTNSTTSRNLSDLFAAFSLERKQTREETAALVEAAVAQHRVPRWALTLVCLLFVIGMTSAAGIVFFTRTEKVLVTIELTDVDLADKDLSFFLDERPVSPEALAKPIELAPGEHWLMVKRGGEVVKRLQLLVTGGRTPGIKMRDFTQPSAVADASPKADRIAAEWALGIGGTVNIEVDGREKRITELPETNFKVKQIDLSRTPVTDEDLQYLEGLTQLGSVGLQRTEITDAGLARLRSLPSLWGLSLQGSKVTDAGLQHLKGLAKMRSLRVDGLPITDAGMSHLKGLDLKTLSLNATQVGDAGLQALPGMDQLTLLWLGSTKVTDAGVPTLAKLPKLAFLSLAFTGVTDEGFRHLGTLRLNTLLMRYTAVTDALIGYLQNSKDSLAALDLGSTRITDNALPQLRDFQKLNFLGLSNTKVTDRGLEHVAHLTDLLKLELHGTTVTHAGLKHLYGLKQLQTLSVPSSAVSASELREMQEALPKCEIELGAPAPGAAR